MLRWLTAGESHGPVLTAILEGLPAHVQVTSQDIADALARRRLGYGRGARMKFEQDEIRITGGVRHGLTQGGPISIEIGNTEWPKWEQVMSADPVDPVELDALARNAALTRPRPGHADLVGHAEVRLPRGAPDPRARLRAGDRGPRRSRPAGHCLPRAGDRCPDGLPRGAARRGLRTGRLRSLTPTTSPTSTTTRCAAWTRMPRSRWSSGSTRPTRTATPSAASWRWSCTDCRPVSAPTCTGTVGWTPGWRAP